MMKIMLAALLLSACGPRQWTRADTAWQVAVTASLAADYSQTRQALDAGGMELNPIMGPSGNRVSPEIYFPVVGSALAGAAVALPPGRWRRALQVAVVALQAKSITKNWMAGYSVQW